MDTTLVTGHTQTGRVKVEAKAKDVAGIHPAPEFVEHCSRLHIEDTNERALFRRGCNSRAVRIDGNTVDR